jgi:hypothetical protein
MDRFEYMRIPAKDIWADIMEQYCLAPLVHNGHVTIVMSSLRFERYVWPSTSRHLSLPLPRPALGSFRLHASQAHAGTFPSYHLSCHLLPRGRQFAIKYVNRVNAKHLLATLWSLYNITTD